jgi:TonB family protein
MKLNKHEQAKPNVAGLTSQVQQAEMQLILADMWPPLKPLPIFKYGTDEYRAEIHFDRTRGEWVCRKTSLPSNRVQELRGGLTEVTMALPHGQAHVFTEAVAAEPQQQELENETNRRLQAILEWRDNYGNGALYSELQDYLSEGQQDQIYDSIRMTLTARQLQFNPKNIEFVFDALWKAGGRLATLIEIAQRNKARQEDSQAQAETAALTAESQVPAETIHPTRDLSIFNNPSVRDEEAAARYEEMFPAESTYAQHTSSVDEIKPQQGPPPIPAGSHTGAGKSVVDSAAEISSGGFPRSLEAGFPSERARHFVPEAIKTEEPPSRFRGLEISGLQAAAFVFLLAVIGFTVGHTVGRGLRARPLRDTQKSILAVDATSAALPNRPGETTSPTSTPPPGHSIDTPAVNPPAPETEELRSESRSAQSSLEGRPADSATRARPTGPSSAVTSRSHIDSVDSSGANKLDDTPPSGEKSKESTRDSESFAKVPSTASNSSPTMESKSSANPEVSPERNGSTGLVAGNTPRAARPQPANSPKANGLISGAPRHPAPRRVTPSMGGAPHPSPPSAILVTAPAKGSKSFRLTFPEKPIAASSSFAMTSQLSVLISPEPGTAVAHQPARLQAGELVSYVWPRYPRPGDRHRSAETVKVRASIGQLGQVLDIKRLSGSTSLLPAAMSAIRQWRYKPTLLNEKPVQAQQDVTIEFRLPQHLSHVHTQRLSHN